MFLMKENGGLTYKTIFVLLILFVVIHIALKLVPMYMDAERLKDEMAIKARFAQTLKDDDILNELEKKAKELELPITRENIIVKRDDATRQISIQTAWDVDVIFLFGAYVRTYHFEPVIQEDYARKF